jgi:dGTPase
LNEISEKYRGTRAQRQLLRQTTAILIRRYLEAVDIVDREGLLKFEREPKADLEVQLLKELVWHYVIAAPGLRSQQYGQERVVRELYVTFRDAALCGDLPVLPVSMRESISEGVAAHRAAADAVAGLSEAQAISIWRRISGVATGYVTDYLGV